MCFGTGVRNFSPSINYWNQTTKLHQQIEISPSPCGRREFAQKGDSGSLVFSVSHEVNKPKLRALGLLVGGTSYGTVIVTPIWAVLKELGLPMRLMAFGGSAEGREERSTNEGVDNSASDYETLKYDMQTLKSVVERNAQKTEEKMTSVEQKMDYKMTSMENQLSNIVNILSQMSANQITNPSTNQNTHQSINPDTNHNANQNTNSDTNRNTNPNTK